MVNNIQKLPKKIEQEIEIYLGPNESILQSICAIGENNDKAGKVWLILTDKSVFFHTEEKNKEPVVALLARNNIKLIEYFQKKLEIIVTFIPASSSKNTTRISFPIQRKDLLEDFCADLADLIDFKKETDSGVKIYSRQPKPKQNTNIKPVDDKPKPEVKAKPTKTTPENDVKLARTPKTTNAQADGDQFPPVGYVVIATVISVIVAFIWYKFFKLISGSRR